MAFNLEETVYGLRNRFICETGLYPSVLWIHPKRWHDFVMTQAAWKFSAATANPTQSLFDLRIEYHSEAEDYLRVDIEPTILEPLASRQEKNHALVALTERVAAEVRLMKPDTKWAFQVSLDVIHFSELGPPPDWLQAYMIFAGVEFEGPIQRLRKWCSKNQVHLIDIRELYAIRLAYYRPRFTLQVFSAA